MQLPVVIEPPEVVVTPAEARTARVFTADDDDDYISMLLAAAQAEIDGSDGWLGRAIGEQTLEVTVPAWRSVDADCLPLPPVIEIVSETISANGRSKTVRYRAGYAQDSVPADIKHSIILMAGVLRDAVPDSGGDIRRETVEGVGSVDYSLPDGAADTMRSAAERLLSRYKILRV